MKFSRQPASHEKKKQYKFGKVLGAGSYGAVKEAMWECPPSGQRSPMPVAVKIIPKKAVKGQEDIVFAEVEVMKDLDHPNITRFWDFFESRDKFYLVFELAQGGELFEMICRQGRFTENDASLVMQDVLGAVVYLHEKNIVHRDLKPENLLYRDKSENSHLVLCDFGIAKHLNTDDEVLTALCGSFGYAAPEILTKSGHGKPADIWSLGVITYTLLCGYTPFRSEERDELIEETTKTKLVFHEKYWKGISDQAKDFVKLLLNPDPAKRPTVQQVLKHPWISHQEEKEQVDLSSNVQGYVTSRQRALSRFRSAVEAIQFTKRLERASRWGESDDESSLASTSPSSGTSRASDGKQHSPPSSESGPRSHDRDEQIKEKQVKASQVREGQSADADAAPPSSSHQSPSSPSLLSQMRDKLSLRPSS